MTVARSNEASATPGAPPDGTAPVLSVAAGAGEATLTWDFTDGTVAATGWEYQVNGTGDWIAISGDGAVRSHTVTGLAAGDVTFMVRPVANGVAGTPSAASTSATVTEAPIGPTFTAGSTSSYSNTNYRVQFQTGAAELNTLRDELVIEFHEDYTH